jgi:signal transduction histidine kinase/tetratricopeptide (TPR) repeat protein
MWLVAKKFGGWLLRPVLVLAMVVCATGAHAQGREIDSLTRLASTATGVKKVDVLNALAFKMLIVEIDKGNEFAESALQNAQQIDYARGKAQATIYKGIHQLLKGNKAPALALLTEGVTMAREHQQTDVMGYGLTQLGNTYRNFGRYDSAKLFYDRAYRVLQDSLHPKELSTVYRNLTQYYKLTGDALNEERFLFKTLRIREHLPDKTLLADVYIFASRWYLARFQLEQALAYLDKADGVTQYDAKEISIDIKEQRAGIFFMQGRYNESIELYEEVKEFYRDTNAIPRYVRLLNAMGEVFWEAGSYDVSLNHYFEALKLAREKNISHEQTVAQLGIGWNYYRLKQTTTARTFVTQALAEAKQNRLRTEEGTAYNVLGLLFKQEKRYEEALPYFQRAYEIRKSLNDRKGEGTSWGNIGETLEALNRLPEALAAIQKSLTIKTAIQHESGLAWAYTDMGSIYFKMRDYKNASLYLAKAEQQARKIKLGVVLVESLSRKRDLLIALGNTAEALRLSLVFERVKDSVTTSAFTSRVLSLQSSYELDAKNHQIQLLNKNTEVQQGQIEQQNLRLRNQGFILALGLLALVLTGAMAFMANRSSKKMKALNQQVRERSEEVQAQAEELLLANNSLTKANIDLAERNEEIQAQAEELTEANSTLVQLNDTLHEKQLEVKTKSDELEHANNELRYLNQQLAENQEELQAQSEELREGNLIISQLNEALEQKVLARTAQLQQAYKELDTFFYRSSHDFRRPLTTFMGLAEVAKITVVDTNALSLFEKVKETALNLDRMLIKLQSISDVGAQQFVYKEISMRQLFDTTLDTYREALTQKKIRTSLAVSIQSRFSSYPAFLKIIVDNLVENAIQFCGHNAPFIALAATEQSGGILLTVEDNGMGVDEEYQSRVFEMFFRGSEQSKGNGLGLYIVHKAVEKLNGTIEFKSASGKGTTVSVWLPEGQPTAG